MIVTNIRQQDLGMLSSRFSLCLHFQSRTCNVKSAIGGSHDAISGSSLPLDGSCVGRSVLRAGLSCVCSVQLDRVLKRLLCSRLVLHSAIVCCAIAVSVISPPANADTSEAVAFIDASD